jgi:hypothetical protein
MLDHAAMRWAKVVVAAIDSEFDPRTLAAWGKTVGVSSGALRTWCRTAHTSPRTSLYFCRMLRAVALAELRGWEPENILDVVDERTLRKLLEQAGIGAKNSEVPTVAGFVRRQRFVSNPSNIVAVLNELALRGRAINDHQVTL